MGFFFFSSDGSFKLHLHLRNPLAFPVTVLLKAASIEQTRAMIKKEDIDDGHGVYEAKLTKIPDSAVRVDG